MRDKTRYSVNLKLMQSRNRMAEKVELKKSDSDIEKID